jgi:hypothetical protein
MAIRGSHAAPRCRSADWFVGVQSYRVLGAIFLVMYVQGRMPAAFALPAGAGDVAIGLLAPIVAVAYARGVPGRESLVMGWNLLGLLDLANAITTGFLTSPSPLQVLSFDAPNQLITEYPPGSHPARGAARQAPAVVDWWISRQPRQESEHGIERCDSFLFSCRRHQS